MDTIATSYHRDVIAEEEDSATVLRSLFAHADPKVAVLPADVREKATKRAAATHLELAQYQQATGKFSNSVVLANAKTMAPASWWAMYAKHVPLLRSVAVKVLAQSVSASAAERNWSTGPCTARS